MNPAGASSGCWGIVERRGDPDGFFSHLANVNCLKKTHGSQRIFAHGTETSRRVQSLNGGSEERVPKVLVVEDDDVLRADYQRVLAVLGAESLPASGVVAAKRIIRREQPELGLVDYGLADGVGTDLIHWWRAQRAVAPIVLVTGHDELGIGFAAGQAGADRVLTKPIGLDELRDCLSLVRSASANNGVIWSVDRVVYEHVQQVLDLVHGRKSTAQKLLGISRTKLEAILDAGPPRR